MRPSKPWYRTSHDAWYVEIDGRQVKLAKGKASKPEAMQAFHRLMAEHTRPDRGKTDLPVAVVCDLFLSWSKSNHKTDTYVWYKNYLQAFVSFRGTGELLSSQLTPSHVTAWLASEPEWSVNSRAAAIASVKRAFAWAETEGHLPSNPVRLLKKPSTTARSRVLTHDERAKVRAAIRDEAFRTFVFALQETGCRPSEVATVTAAQVNLTLGVWTFEDHKTAKRTGKPRVVYLTPPMVELSKKLMALYPEGPLFRSRGGRPFSRNAIRIRFMRLRKKLPELKGVTAYAYRHTYATDALENGVGVCHVS